METPETEPVSRVTHLIRTIEKHIKRMTDALNELEKTDFPHKYLSEENSGMERRANMPEGTDKSAS